MTHGCRRPPEACGPLGGLSPHWRGGTFAHSRHVQGAGETSLAGWFAMRTDRHSSRHKPPVALRFSVPMEISWSSMQGARDKCPSDSGRIRFVLPSQEPLARHGWVGGELASHRSLITARSASAVQSAEATSTVERDARSEGSSTDARRAAAAGDGLSRKRHQAAVPIEEPQQVASIHLEVARRRLPARVSDTGQPAPWAGVSASGQSPQDRPALRRVAAR